MSKKENEQLSSTGGGGGNSGRGMMRFVNEPKVFSGVNRRSGGDVSGEAHAWLKRMTRLKLTAKLSDEETLFIAGDHLVEKAGTWWNVVGYKSETWKEFTEAFQKQYLADQEDRWWAQLQTMKQGENDSIDDVALQMEELFSLLNNTNDRFQVRTFLSAIYPAVAYEVEKDSTPSTFSMAKNRAKQVERSLMKYGVSSGGTGRLMDDRSTVGINVERSVVPDNFSSAMSTINSLADRLEQLTINLVRADKGYDREFRGATAFKGQRGLVCYHCNEDGHKKYDFPKLVGQKEVGREEGAPSIATGPNAVPLSGKEKERQ